MDFFYAFPSYVEDRTENRVPEERSDVRGWMKRLDALLRVLVKNSQRIFRTHRHRTDRRNLVRDSNNRIGNSVGTRKEGNRGSRTQKDALGPVY